MSLQKGGLRYGASLIVEGGTAHEEETTIVQGMTEENGLPSSAHEIARHWVTAGLDPQLLELAILLRRATEIGMTSADRVLASYGITRGQFDILTALHPVGAAEGQGVTQADLAARMVLTAPGMSKRLAGLFREGLIDRAVDPLDARRLVIRLTEAGAAVLDQITSEEFAAESARLVSLTGAQRRQLVTLLRRIVEE